MENWLDHQWVNQMTIRLDFSNMMSDFVGERRGITKREIDELIPRTLTIAGDIEKKRKSGEWGFFQLPYDIKKAEKVLQIAASFQSRCDDFVILGIGGSVLGGIALFYALCHPLYNLKTKTDRGSRPRIFFLDNIDPATFSSVLDFINLDRTVFNVVTKSGTTPETISQFLIVRQMITEALGKDSVRKHLVITSGIRNRQLKNLAEEGGYQVLSIPENVAGRFSVLSPVGLFPAAMAGIDILELLAGARHADDRCRTDQLWQNPAFLSGVIHYLADVRKGLNIVVMMPYSDALIQLAYWFRQLWAESLGKAETTSGKLVNVGQTPLVASGVTDQHSLLQLFSEGPFNKMITFLLVENPGITVPIPPQEEQNDEFSYLGEHSLEELMKVESQATQLALAKAGRSNMSFIIPEINPFTIGQLLFLLEAQTVFTGGLYDINPMNQPGVEASKNYTYGILGRNGFEDKANEVEEWRDGKTRFIL